MADTFEWTNTSSSASTTESTQTATVAVGGPAFGYTGPTDVLVYWDTVYNSWMFAFASDLPSLTGVINDKQGNPVADAAVTLSVGPETFSTFTDTKGGCRFYGAPSGQADLSVRGEDFAVMAGQGPGHTIFVNLSES